MLLNKYITTIKDYRHNFLKTFLTEGDKPCDDEAPDVDLPLYYNYDLFKKGQQFFHKHFAAMIFSKVLGLMTLLSAPSAAIISMTNRSNSPSSSMKRYISTFSHVMTWYEDDLKLGSKSYDSLKSVRKMHCKASKESKLKLNYRITQRDMSATLFGFMGFVITRSKMVGIYDVTNEELEGFVHFWRVIGYMLGIDDRFSLCRDSIEKTKETCNLFIEEVKVFYNKPSDDFKILTTAFYDGIKLFDRDVQLFYLQMLLDNDSNSLTINNNLTSKQKYELKTTILILSLLKFTPFRIMLNLTLILLWKLMKFVRLL